MRTPPSAPATSAKGAPARRTRAVISVAAVIAIFALIVTGKGGTQRGDPSAGVSPSGGSMTAKHNDAVADYADAVKTGKPVYVLFHSLMCQPCVQISAVADRVVPRYEGKIVFVNAITDDPSAQRLASKFSFQYIPTSFFVAPGGRVVDSHTGVLGAAEMQARLDALAGQ